jgi:hypothetical protein
VTFNGYSYGDGIKEAEEKGNEKELDMLVNVKLCLLKKAGKRSRTPLILKLGIRGR